MARQDLITIVNQKLGNNTYIISNEKKQALIIDPSFSHQQILTELKNNDLTPVAMLLTHAHFDHAMDCELLACQFRIKMYVSRSDETTLAKFHCAEMCGLEFRVNPDHVVYFDSKQGTLEIAGFKLSIIHTPGHTAGSVSFIYNDYLFSGDTLFVDSVGRTDLQTSDPADLTKSIKKLFNLNKNYLVLPGHGTNGWLDDIKKHNSAAKAEFKK